jgi:hypothetical protein
MICGSFAGPVLLMRRAPFFPALPRRSRYGRSGWRAPVPCEELYFITKINELLAEYPALGARYKPINIRVVELEGDLDYPSKLDRSGAMIERLMRNGQERAAWFFDGRSLWPR